MTNIKNRIIVILAMFFILLSSFSSLFTNFSPHVQTSSPTSINAVSYPQSASLMPSSFYSFNLSYQEYPFYSFYNVLSSGNTFYLVGGGQSDYIQEFNTSSDVLSTFFIPSADYYGSFFSNNSIVLYGQSSSLKPLLTRFFPSNGSTEDLSYEIPSNYVSSGNALIAGAYGDNYSAFFDVNSSGNSALLLFNNGSLIKEVSNPQGHTINDALSKAYLSYGNGSFLFLLEDSYGTSGGFLKISGSYSDVTPTFNGLTLTSNPSNNIIAYSQNRFVFLSSYAVYALNISDDKLTTLDSTGTLTFVFSNQSNVFVGSYSGNEASLSSYNVTGNSLANVIKFNAVPGILFTGGFTNNSILLSGTYPSHRAPLFYVTKNTGVVKGNVSPLGAKVTVSGNAVTLSNGSFSAIALPHHNLVLVSKEGYLPYSSYVNSSKTITVNLTQAQPQTIVSKNLNGVSNAEVQQAVDPTNGYIYELWIASNGIDFSRSTDGGYSFGPAITVPGSYYTSPSPSSGNMVQYSWDPAIAVDRNGTIYAAYMFGSGLQNDTPRVAVSYNHGVSFQFFSSVNPTNISTFSDRDYIAVAPNGTVYVTWNYAPNSSMVTLDCSPVGSCSYYTGDFNILFSSSTDGGRTWSEPVHVSPNYPYGGALAAPLLVQNNGRIDVLYNAFNTSADHVIGRGYEYFTSSNNGGQTWSKPVLVGNYGNSISPTEWWIDGSLAIGSNGELYATYDTQNSTVDTAWFTSSTDGGSTWSQPIQMNPPDGNSPNIMAEVTAGSNERVYVTWMSNSSAGGWSIFARVISDNGATMSQPYLLSQNYGVNYIWGGDTTGLTHLSRGRIIVSWGAGTVTSEGILSEIYATVFTLNGFYNVTFQESGLKTGTTWWIDLSNGESYHSTLQEISFTEPNGTYHYVANATGSYHINNASGNFTVNGASSAAVQIKFSSSGLSPWIPVVAAISAVAVISALVVYVRRKRSR